MWLELTSLSFFLIKVDFQALTTNACFACCDGYHANLVGQHGPTLTPDVLSKKKKRKSMKIITFKLQELIFWPFRSRELHNMQKNTTLMNASPITTLFFAKNTLQEMES